MGGKSGILPAIMLSIGLWVPSAWSQDAHPTGLVVVELFTSQGCYSCPPAEAYLGELSAEAGILALEWHVDYWDTLVYGAAGRWADPYSDPAFTQRQSAYNQSIRQTNRIYTPQMVIDGVAEAVGSRSADVGPIIATAKTRKKPAIIAFEIDGDNGLTVSIDGTPSEQTSIWVVRFYEERTTEVLRGENHGKMLTSHNVVTGLERLADWQGGPLRISTAVSEPEMGCAILIQNGKAGPIEGASLCPSAASS